MGNAQDVGIMWSGPWLSNVELVRVLALSLHVVSGARFELQCGY